MKKAKKAKSTARRDRKGSPRRSAAIVRAERYDAGAKFTVDKENPRRPGTVQYSRYEILKRYSGKTVGALPEKDHTGLVMALRYAEAVGIAKIAKVASR
jgi:hypothetical protein